MTLSLLDLYLHADDRDADSLSAFSHPSPARESHPSARRVLLDDRAIVAQIRVGDIAAFDALYLDTFRELWHFARRYVGSAMAEDVVQDVFLRIWERRTKWDVRTTVRAYLFGAVRNRALHHREHEQVEDRASVVILAEATSSVPPADDDSVIIDAVRQAIAALPERQRAAMILRVQRELTHAELGEALQISAAAAGVLVRKGEAKLRQALRAYLPPES